jgi:demethylmenaquinone methyltransferase/2-methoxy-6-polyprenyl-1,4-benzoquinol methylase
MTAPETSTGSGGGPGENAPPSSDTADFGYRRVRAADKAGLVRGVFDNVASRYDVMNDLMSGGVHRLWKAALIERLQPRPGETILDVAGGTGDVARGIRHRTNHADGAGARIVLCDINEAMLNHGRDRFIDANMLDGIEYVAGDAEHLPIASRSIDAYAIAFGLRNVTHIDAALREAHRVLKIGGRFFCLEFSHVALAPLRRAYDLYSFNVLPRLGQVVAGDRESYQYLVESIRRFPEQAELADRMRGVGFDQVRWRDFTFGVAALHSGWRI